MYLYLEIHTNVMSKKSVKVIPGLDVSNFLGLLGQGKHLPFSEEVFLVAMISF